MELTQLRYFMAVADSLHFSRTAEVLHISQSALRMSIARLERELGVKLFERAGRTVRLTDAGFRLQQKLIPALAAVEEARSELLALSEMEQKPLEISVEVIDFAEEFLMHFRQDCPEVRFRQTFDVRDTAVERFACGKTDFCFSYEPFDLPGVTSTLLQTDRVLLLVHRDHSLANRDAIYLEEVSDQPFVTMGPAYGFRRWTDQLCFQAGFRPNIYYEVCDLQSITRTVETGQAVGLICRSTWAQNQIFHIAEQSGDFPLRMLPILNAHCVRRVYLCWPSGQEHNPNAARLIRYAKNQFHL